MPNPLFAEQLGSIAERGLTKLGQLRGVLHKAFTYGVSRTDVFRAVRDAGVEIKRNDFMRYSRNLYEHWNKAVNEVKHWYDTGRFRISALPQQNINTEGRFWGLAQYTVRTGKGKYEKRYMVYSFDQIAPVDDVSASIAEYVTEN